MGCGPCHPRYCMAVHPRSCTLLALRACPLCVLDLVRPCHDRSVFLMPMYLSSAHFLACVEMRCFHRSKIGAKSTGSVGLCLVLCMVIGIIVSLSSIDCCPRNHQRGQFSLSWVPLLLWSYTDVCLPAAEVHSSGFHKGHRNH